MKRNAANPRVGPQGALFEEPAADAAVTEVRPLPRDPNRRSVKVNGRKVATLRGIDVDELKLAAGKRWTPALAKRVAIALAADKARRDGMRLLSQRPRSRRELIERLTGRGHSNEIADLVADEAVRDGWLDEKAYADDVVRGVTSRRPAGRRLLLEKLRNRGVDEAVAERVTKDAAAQQNDRVAALTLARRRLTTMSEIEPATALRRIAGLLARRGFDEDTVQSTLEGLRLILRASGDED